MISNSRSVFASRRCQRTAAALASLVALELGSCVINTGSHREISGRYIGDQTFEQISPGKNKEFVLAVLGEPSSKTPLSDGTEIWKWVYKQKNKSSGSFLFVFNGDSTTETETATFVQFKNEVVSQSWRD
jgi:outer membrane protein assembly factor BamE (lipoprotein component of BamABCDE complex)